MSSQFPNGHPPYFAHFFSWARAICSDFSQVKARWFRLIEIHPMRSIFRPFIPLKIEIGHTVLKAIDQPIKGGGGRRSRGKEKSIKIDVIWIECDNVWRIKRHCPRTTSLEPRSSRSSSAAKNKTEQRRKNCETSVNGGRINFSHCNLIGIAWNSISNRGRDWSLWPRKVSRKKNEF